MVGPGRLRRTGPGTSAGTAGLGTLPTGGKEAADPRRPQRAAVRGVWRLAEGGRQLDANVLNLSGGQTIGTHAEPDLDVILVIVAGTGTMGTETGPLALVPGELVWLPRGSSRSLTAGTDGLAYLTVHRRRPGMKIRTSGHGPDV